MTAIAAFRARKGVRPNATISRNSQERNRPARSSEVMGPSGVLAAPRLVSRRAPSLPGVGAGTSFAKTCAEAATIADPRECRMSSPSDPVLTLVYLNAPDVAALALTDDEILAAVESGL